MTMYQALEQGVLVSISRHGEVQVWNTQTGARNNQRLRHSLADASVTPNAALLVMAPRYDSHVQVWSIHRRMATRRFMADPAETFRQTPAVTKSSPQALREALTLGWNSKRTLVAAASADGHVLVLDPSSGRALGPAIQHPPAVGAVAVSEDGKLLVTSRRDQEIRFWQVATGKSTGIVIRPENFVSNLALTNDGTQLVTITDAGEIRVWETGRGNSLTPPIRAGAGIDAVHISEDATRLIYRLPERGWFSLPMPPKGIRLPGWFLDLSEAIARRRLTSDAQAETLTLADLKKAIAAGSQLSPLRLRFPGPADARPAGSLPDRPAASAAGNRARSLGPGLSRLRGRRTTTMSDFLVIDNASVSFPGRGRAPANLAVDGVSLTLAKGEILGLVGESGCGKSTLSRAIMQLQPLTSGRIILEGQDLSLLDGSQLRAARLNFQMVFQDPYASLNPRVTIFSTLAEAIQARTGKLSGPACWTAVEKLLERVGLDPTAALKYPHEFSGGQRQRIAIARALGPEPRLLIADEPVSALDVSIQSQIINLLLKLSRELQLTMLFVSHDLSVVRYLADRTAVMHRGKIVELGETEALMAAPQHEYSKALLAAAPALRMRH